MKIENLKTPTILLNIEALENNIKRCVMIIKKNFGP